MCMPLTTSLNLWLFLTVRKPMHVVLEQLKWIPIATQADGRTHSKFNGKKLLILFADC